MAKRTPPVKIGEVYPVNIRDISHKGEGIGSHRGFTVFVPGGVPGDSLRVRIISVKPSYARGLIASVDSRSPLRVDACCETYEPCGGCQIQHIDYQEQLRLKERIVKETLVRIGGLESVVVEPIKGMACPWHYRNKAQFPVGGQPGNITAGCYQIRTHNIVNIRSCAIQHSLINTGLEVVRKAVNKFAIEPYDEERHRGILRHIVLRVGAATRQLMVVLVTRVKDFPGKAELAQCIGESLPEAVSVVQNINPHRTNVILGPETLPLYGRDYIEDVLLGVTYRISARSFYQVNPRQTEILYRTALDYAALGKGDTVFDAYCGIGTITLTLAREAGFVYGVEVVPEAVADARQNAKLNDITNVDFITGKSETVIPQMIAEGKVIDCLVVDPPRKGCDEELLQAAADAGIPRIVYVSCNPSTLARDLRFLSQRGYLVDRVQPVDMFPHTAHVETAVLIEKK